MAEEGTTRGRKGARMKRRAGVWVHFTETRDGDGNVTAECKECKARLVGDHGTSSLWKHAELCHGAVRSPKRPKQQQQQPPCDPSRSGCGSSPEREPGAGLEEDDDEEASRDLARMIALHGFDPSIVEDDHFMRFLRRLNPGFKVPSRCDIEEMCDGILDVQERLHKQFEIQCKLLLHIQEKLKMIQCKSSKEKVQNIGGAAPICSAQETAPVAASPPDSISSDEEAGAVAVPTSWAGDKRSATGGHCVVEVASPRRAVLQSMTLVDFLRRPEELQREAAEREERRQEVTRLQRPAETLDICPHPIDRIELKEALRLQVECQKRLHKQVEFQKQLHKKIEECEQILACRSDELLEAAEREERTQEVISLQRPETETSEIGPDREAIFRMAVRMATHSPMAHYLQSGV